MSSEGRITMSSTLRSEWTKLVSLRSTKVMVGLAIVASIALTALLSIVVGSTWHSWDAAARRDFNAVDTALVGGVVTAILFMVLGVKAATSEYGSGMIRLTLTATPQRWRILAAKAAVVTGITVVAGLVSTVGMLLMAQAVLGSYGLQTPHLGDTPALNAILAGSVIAPLFPLIAMTLGMALRSTAAAIIATLGVLFAPPFIGGLLPASWHDALRYFPGAASDAITGAQADGLAPGLGAVVTVAWLAVFLGSSLALFERRDA
jgi:ABC-type transport system involved in multi-copper enzyme maturation permease subunit